MPDRACPQLDWGSGMTVRYKSLNWKLTGVPMDSNTDLANMDAKVQLMRKTANELKHLGKDFPALTRNLVRIEASLKMLEINISDVVDLDR
jgi:hypothetical protein